MAEVTLEHIKQACAWAKTARDAAQPIDGEVRRYKQSQWDCGTSCCVWGAAHLLAGNGPAQGPPPKEWRDKDAAHTAVFGLLCSNTATPEMIDAVANLRDANLSGADLSGAGLSGADLSGANLRDANLRDADLRDADLSDANLSVADLSDAYLSGANLRGANLRGAKLGGANLSDADLRGAKLSGANLSGAKLSGAKLSGAWITLGNRYVQLK